MKRRKRVHAVRGAAVDERWAPAAQAGKEARLRPVAAGGAAIDETAVRQKETADEGEGTPDMPREETAASSGGSERSVEAAGEGEGTPGRPREETAALSDGGERSAEAAGEAGGHRNVLQMKGICKTFPGVRALDAVDFELRGGEIHGLLGANGAGKSTLMKVLSGTYRADAGQLWIDGRELRLHSPADAMRSGIYCVQQEVDAALVPTLSVAENVLLDRFAFGRAAVSWRRLYREAEQVMARVGLEVNPRSPAAGLTIAQKQLVLLARALSHRAHFLILDEPTAPLSGEETNRLFALVGRLRDEGLGVVFISHRLPEVFALCDVITVMKNGRRERTLRAAESSLQEIVRLMLGRTLQEEFPQRLSAPGEVLLEARGIGRSTKVRAASLEVRRGEVVGVAGLVGAGKSELGRLMCGADLPDAGALYWKGSRLRLRSPRDAVRAGIVLVPEERRAQGVFLDESVEDNLTLPSLRRWSRFGFVLRSRTRQAAADLIARFGIVPSRPERKVRELSGGNQQKAAIAKWLPLGADLYLFDEPTKGVDVGAKSEIFNLIGELADQGKGIVYFSCEIEEILGIADRILVMSYGMIVKELTREAATAESILYYASAGGEDNEAKMA